MKMIIDYVRTYALQLCTLGLLLLIYFISEELIGPAVFFVLQGPGGGCSNGSTPFLYVWNGLKYVIENDVMFGKPSSRFGRLEEGVAAYKKGEIVPDRYVLQNRPKIVDGKVHFQLKEIEPEKSSVDFFSLSAVAVPKGHQLIPRADFTGSLALPRAALKTAMEKPKRLTLSRSGVTTTATRRVSRQAQLQFEAGEWLEIEVRKDDDQPEQYLLLDTWYRDWTLGPIYWNRQVGFRSRTRSRLGRRVAEIANRNKIAAAVLTALMIGFGMGALLANEQPVYADDTLGRSFEVAFKTLSGYKLVEVIEPRYFRPSLNAIALPEEAFVDGIATIRITATKKHNLSGIGHLGADPAAQISMVHETGLPVLSVVDRESGEDITEALRHEADGNFMTTHPGSLWELTFDASAIPTAELYDIEYSFRMGGVYQYVDEAEQQQYGDWTKDLDEDALAFLEDVYALNHPDKT